MTTFDYADAIDFFKGKQLVETYVGCGRGDAKVSDAFHKIFETIIDRLRHDEIYGEDVLVSALFIFSVRAGSAIPLDDIDRMLEDKRFTDIQMHSPVFMEDPDLETDGFCAHLILARENPC